jgi:fimbrial chaperone protein
MLHFRCAAVLAAWLLASSAHAGSFSVAPVRIDMKMPRRAAAVEVQNTGEAAAQLQVERFRWLADRGGEDQLEATEDIVVTPPIFTLAPGQKQIVRVLLFGDIDPAREASYRLIFQETALNDPPPNTVQALLRISMPVFVSPPNAKSSLAWTVAREADQWWLTAENIGNAHAQITALRTASGQELKASGYLLPGERRRFAVDRPVDKVLVTLRDEAEQAAAVSTVP